MPRLPGNLWGIVSVFILGYCCEATEMHAIFSWPRMPADAFGCYLEETFGHRDETFHCSLTAYRNQGDPCHNTTAYYEGPAFPDALAHVIHPDAEQVLLSWEHGELQRVEICFQKAMTEEALIRDLGVPTDEQRPENIMSLSIHASPTLCLQLIGLDHMGAGEVECPKKEK
jgi:hypothetical protein